MIRLLFFLTIAFFVHGAPKESLITDLPSVDFYINFKQYAGYLNGSDTHKLFYWFVESQKNATEDPLVLWLTGGPGCSSLSALFMENGPFKIAGRGEVVYENPLAWNKVANIIFLEAPAGVGYSYATDKNIRTNDNKTAEENYRALKHFLELYPEYAQRDFYLTGESYAGFYVPTLASWLIKDKTINFKGLAIGNGFMSAEKIYNTLPPFLYNHNLIPEDLWTDVVQCCKGNPYECDYFSMMKNTSSLCYNTTISAISTYYDYGLDPYDIYFTCDDDTRPTIQLGMEPLTILPRFSKSHARKENMELIEQIGNSCPVYNRTDIYLNRMDVRKALRVDQASANWAMCSDALSNETVYVTLYEDMYQQFADIFAMPDIRVLLYNGDTDTVCNSIANQKFAKSLNRKLLKPTRPWIYSPTKPNVGGMVTRFDRLDYLTVRGAGHQVPSSKPGPSLQMFANFLKNQPYDQPLSK